MDLTGRLRRFGALADGPRPALVLAIGQEGDQAQQLIGALDQAVQTGFFNAQILQEHGPLLRIVQLRDILLQLGTDGQHLCALLGGQIPDGLEIGIVLVVGEALLVHIGGIDDGLQAQQIRRFDNSPVVAAVKGAGGLSCVQMLRQRLEYLCLTEELLVALGGFGGLLHPAVHHLQIGHDQLQIDRLDVAQRVHRHVLAGVSHHMHDVLVVKAAHHMNDGVGTANVLQKLVAKSRTLRRALHQTGNVHKFNDGRGFFVRLIHLRQLVQPCVRHSHHAHIRLDGAEGIVGALRPGVGNGIKQRAFSYIR